MQCPSWWYAVKLEWTNFSWWLQGEKTVFMGPACLPFPVVVPSTHNFFMIPVYGDLELTNFMWVFLQVDHTTQLGWYRGQIFSPPDICWLFDAKVTNLAAERGLELFYGWTLPSRGSHGVSRLGLISLYQGKYDLLDTILQSTCSLCLCNW